MGVLLLFQLILQKRFPLSTDLAALMSLDLTATTLSTELVLFNFNILTDHLVLGLVISSRFLKSVTVGILLKWNFQAKIIVIA